MIARVGVVLLAGVACLRAGAETKDPPSCVIGDHALAQGQPQLALEEYKKCITESAPSLKSLSNLGMTYAQLNQFDQAIQSYQQALAFDANNPPIRLNLGLAYLKTNRPEQAAKQFARSLMADPSNLRALELLAICHLQMKEFELAGYEAEQVLNADPKESSAAFLLGSSLLNLGDYHRAIPLIYSSVGKSESPNAHLVLGEAFLGVRAFSQALKEFEQAERLAPDLEGIHSKLGSAYAGLGDSNKALAEFHKELEKNPNNFDANFYVGRLNRLANNMDEARKYLTKAETLRPGDPPIAYEFAVLAMQDKDYAKAETLLRKILQAKPDYVDAHVLLAEVYFKTHRTAEGQREKALVDAMKSAEQERLNAQGKALQQAYEDSKKQNSSPHP